MFQKVVAGPNEIFEGFFTVWISNDKFEGKSTPTMKFTVCAVKGIVNWLFWNSLQRRHCKYDSYIDLALLKDSNCQIMVWISPQGSIGHRRTLAPRILFHLSYMQRFG
jgi:hypothetical protein